MGKINILKSEKVIQNLSIEEYFNLLKYYQKNKFFNLLNDTFDANNESFNFPNTCLEHLDEILFRIKLRRCIESRPRFTEIRNFFKTNKKLGKNYGIDLVQLRTFQDDPVDTIFYYLENLLPSFFDFSILKNYKSLNEIEEKKELTIFTHVEIDTMNSGMSIGHSSNENNKLSK